MRIEFAILIVLSITLSISLVSSQLPWGVNIVTTPTSSVGTINLNQTFILNGSWLISPPYLYNDTNTLYFNETLLNATIDLRSSGVGVYVPYSGASSTVNLNGQQLTNVGALIVAGLTTSQDLFPATDNLYSIGNSTNRYASLYANKIYGKEINSTNITSTNIATNIIDAGNANVSANLTIGGFKVNEEGGNLSITLQ